MATVITVNSEEFFSLFPYFQDKSSVDDINTAYEIMSSFIPVQEGALEVPLKTQTMMVYLAVAHYLYLQLNPSRASSANITNASEGSVSAGMNLYDSAFKRWLAISPYGAQLLALLSMLQPPMPRKDITPYPYYPSVGSM